MSSKLRMAPEVCVHVEPPNDLDSSSGCELSFELSSDNLRSPSPTPRLRYTLNTPGPNPSYSPPYKKVRALRLFDSPLTPKTIIEKSAATPALRSRLFTDKPRTAGTSQRSEKPTANVNPFTPNGELKGLMKGLWGCFSGGEGLCVVVKWFRRFSWFISFV